MDEKYHIVKIDHPEESAWGIIGRGVGDFNKQQAGDNKFQRLCFVLHDTDQEIVGGVIAESYWDWLYICLLYTSPSPRDRTRSRMPSSA